MFEYQAVAVRVVDGDTLDVIIDLGFRIEIRQRVRLFGIDTPERGQPKATAATQTLSDLVLVGSPALTIRSVKPHDKYGRWLAIISTPSCADVAQALIDAGLGVPYLGGAKT